jgi:hypothetical protein
LNSITEANLAIVTQLAKPPRPKREKKTQNHGITLSHYAKKSRKPRKEAEQMRHFPRLRQHVAVYTGMGKDTLEVQSSIKLFGTRLRVLALVDVVVDHST